MKNIAIVLAVICVFCLRHDCFADDLAVIDVSMTLVTAHDRQKIDNGSYIEWKFTDFVISSKIKYTGTKLLKNVSVRIAYIPEIGKIVYADPNDDFVSIRDTERTSYWFAPLSIKSIVIDEIKPNHTEEININIPLHDIILDYDKRDLWVTACKFVISIEPQGPEDNMNNNTKEFVVKIMTPTE